MFTDTRRVAKKPSQRKLNQIDNDITAIFTRKCSGVQIPVLRIQDIFRAGRAAALAGQDVEAAVLAAVATITQP